MPETGNDQAGFGGTDPLSNRLAFGVAAMAIGMGVIFVLIGLGIRDVEQQLVE